jgi:hypothetical protein
VQAEDREGRTKAARRAFSLDGTDSELPAAGEEAIFKHYGLTYQPGAAVNGG